MPDAAQNISLLVTIPSNQHNPDDSVDETTRRLLREVRESGIDAEMVTSGPGPAGAKGDELTEIGKLALTFAPAALPQLVDLFKGWMGRGRGRTMKLQTANGASLELSGDLSVDDVKSLIDSLNSRSTPVPQPH